MKRLWFFVPVLILIFAVAYAQRERLVQEPGVPDTGSASSAATSTSEIAAAENAEATSSAPSISFLPGAIIQGDPVEIVVNNVPAAEVESISYNGASLGIFSDNGRAAAVLGVRVSAATGSYPVKVILSDGSVLKAGLAVGERVKPQEQLGIPASLGGNTPQAAQNLVSNLTNDNAVLNAVPSASKALWQGTFRYPVNDPVITDTYGYSRSTVGETIIHEGTDFHAPPGTPVYAMNSGKVALAEFLTSYGNTIVLDHGLGVQTLYLHLSEMEVKPGDMVQKGELIGKSGETGYAEGPHLHLSIKINHISIDPQEFLKLF